MSNGNGPLLPSGLLTAEEVAGIIQKPERTLRDWRKRRIGPPFYKLHGDIRYGLADLYGWLGAQWKATRSIDQERLGGVLGLRSEQLAWESIERLIQAAVDRRVNGHDGKKETT